MPSLNSMLLQLHAKHEEVAGTQVRSWSSGGGGKASCSVLLTWDPWCRAPQEN